jgi:release factor glutamine methyltransferase
MTARSPAVPFAFAGGVSVAAAAATMTALFTDAGIGTPALDARILLCAILGIDAAVLIAHPDRKLGSEALALTAAVNRRLAREPVSRILGVRDFYGRAFEVSPATLAPRPDTETIVDAVLAHVAARSLSGAPLRIIDVGTGTGCLLITLLAELPNATGAGTDISQPALEVARSNAAKHGVLARSVWKIADGLEELKGPFDVLVTNPPYIRTADIAGLVAEVQSYDPHLALDGGHDGLTLYRRIVADFNRLIPNGYAVLEVGYDQSVDVAALLSAEGRRWGWPNATIIKDLSGHARCVAQITHV